MLSTFSGLMLGVVTAAAVTVFYGEEIGSRLRDLVARDLNLPERVELVDSSHLHEPAPDGISGQTDLPLDTTEELAGARQAGPASMAPGTVQAQQVDSRDAVERRWAEYRSGAADMKPVGEFPYRDCFQRAAAAHGVPETLLLAVASGESDFDLAARSPKNAVGLMQIQWPGTSRHLGILREADLYDPCTNVDAGARYLAELKQRYEGDLHRTLAAYNYGPSRISTGPLPDGAIWYSQYIYQRLQKILGLPHVASSELVGDRPGSGSGYHVLMTFNRSYRARAFLQYVSQLVPSGLELAQRSESLGRHEVVLLYGSSAERERGLQLIRATELLALAPGGGAANSL